MGDKTDNKKERQKLHDKLQKEIGKIEDGHLPLNIALIGPTGCGKSSFINTFAAAIAEDCWRLYADSGKGEDTQKTVRLKNFKGSRYGADWVKRGYALPTMVDLVGFADEDTALTEEILRLILYGKLRDETNINDIYKFSKEWKEWGIGALQTRYALVPTLNESKIDRVIFVASAGEKIPENLIRCLLKAAQPKGVNYTRSIPVFGILTNADKATPGSQDFDRVESSFIKALGMIGSKTKYTKCSNYCDDVDQEQKRSDTFLPELDIPVLKFMVQVCQRSLDVSNPNETYTAGISAWIAGRLKSTVSISCLRMFIYLILYTVVTMLFGALFLLSVNNNR